MIYLLNRFRPWWRRMIFWTACCAVAAVILGYMFLQFALWCAPPLDIDSLYGRNSSSTLFDRRGRVLRAYLAPDQRWRIPVTADEITTSIMDATIAVEDKRFWEHHGIDWTAAMRAAWQNLFGGRIVSGASTLTMQAAMFDQTKEGRTLGWKCRQVWRALRLERQLSKREILALYLSNAPYGGNIHGIEAASQRYFGVSSQKLDLDSAALLAGIPQSPTRLRPDRNLSATLARRTTVLNLMAQQGRISAKDAETAMHEMPVIESANLPRYAPHFTDLVHSLYPRLTRSETALDLPMQIRAEEMLNRTLEGLKGRGVGSGAIVVIENATGSVLVMVGSGRFDDKNAGQVNAALASRSPGSALKPLLYAKAYDLGILLPCTMLQDVPVGWGSYVPENFNRTFQGLIRADKALAWSLNIPAVEVLNRLTVPVAVAFLRDCGLMTIEAQTPTGNSDYGLSLATGSCGVRLVDLTNAYAMLARGGEWRPWRVCTIEKETTSTTTRLSAGAAYFAMSSLADTSLRAPEGINSALYGLQNVAWKTGTSAKYRDAWTIAVNGDFTVGVWLGNVSGKSSRALVGAEVAAPLALALLRDIRHMELTAGRSIHDEWPVRPKRGLADITVCVESGLPAQEYCPTTATAQAILEEDGLTLAIPPRCYVHRQVPVDAVTGEELCADCMSGHTVATRVCAFWPVTVSSFLEQRGIIGRSRHNPKCSAMSGGDNPKIVCPKTDVYYVMDSTRPVNQQKIELKAVAAPDAKHLWWFAGDELVAEGTPDDRLWWIPVAGTAKLRVTDDRGRVDTVIINVTRP